MTIEQTGSGGVKGRIEVITGRSVKLVPEKLAGEKKVIVPERPAVSEMVADFEPLIPFDESMRLEDGYIWMSTLRSPRKDQEEELTAAGCDPRMVLIERWGKHRSIDTVFRATEHIVEQYEAEKGQRTQHLKEAIKQSNIAAHALQEQNVDLKRLAEVKDRLATAMASTGLSGAYNIFYQDIVAQLDRALSPDRLNRPNTARSRLMRGYVHPLFVRALFVNRRTDTKNGNRNSLIFQERDFEQGALRFVQRRCDQLIQANAVNFRHGIKSFRDLAYAYLSPDVIKVRPYIEPAALVWYLLHSSMDEEAIATLGRHIGQDNAQQVSRMDLAPFSRLGDIASQKDVLRDVSGIIGQAIKKSDKRLTTSWEDLIFEDPGQAEV